MSVGARAGDGGHALHACTWARVRPGTDDMALSHRGEGIMAGWIARNINVSCWLLRGCSFRRGAIAAAAALVMSWTPALAQFVQQGPKLVGAGANVAPNATIGGPGKSAALSADGNTAIVGDPEHNNRDGAAWIFVRHNGAWMQQARLVGTGAIGTLVAQGDAVALSADGNTAVVGGPGDNNGVGAAWIFTRSFSGLSSSVATWTQQAKLVGANPVGASEQGSAVAVSADGTTALVGGGFDNGRKGAVWVFVRTVVSNTKGTFVEWAQQGSKLTAGNEVGNGWFGNSVALSADGNTAAVGAVYDNNGIGAAWVFARTPGTVAWVQGPKLIGSNAVGTAGQGTSVALSGDGNTAIVGGLSDNNEKGAAWVFARKTVFTLGGNVVEWVQQAKLVGTGGAGPRIGQGSSVALSGDGNTAMVGGTSDNGFIGAAWVFTRSTTGSSVNPVATWTQQGSKLVGTDWVGEMPSQGSPVALSAD